MSLTTVTTGGQINASDINQLVNVLQQPSGGTDTGSVEVAGWSNAASDVISSYIPSRSRGSTPVSVTISTSYFDGPTNITTPLNASHLDANGVQIWQTSSVANANCHVGTTFTWQY
jgi:hypothetical protein